MQTWGKAVLISLIVQLLIGALLIGGALFGVIGESSLTQDVLSSGDPDSIAQLLGDARAEIGGTLGKMTAVSLLLCLGWLLWGGIRAPNDPIAQRALLWPWLLLLAVTAAACGWLGSENLSEDVVGQVQQGVRTSIGVVGVLAAMAGYWVATFFGSPSNIAPAIPGRR